MKMLIKLVAFSVLVLLASCSHGIEQEEIDKLIEDLNKGGYYTSKSAAEDLIKIGKPAVRPLIEVLKTSRVVDARRAAAWALGRIKDKRAIEQLVLSLRSDVDCYVRSNAAGSLSLFRDKRAVVPLINAFNDVDTNVAITAAESLGSLKDKRAVDPLIDLLGNNNPYLRRAAARALGYIGDRKAVGYLIEALKDEEQAVCLDTEKALKEITKADHGSSYDKWKEWYEDWENQDE